MDQKLRESGPVLFNRQIAEGIYHLSVQAPRIAAASRPGQFVQVKVASEPPVQFLRMPFAVFDVDESAGSVDVCYQVVGEGTEQLSHVVIGAQTVKRLACTEQFEDSIRASGGALHVATDDGSAGIKGFVNAITDELLATRAYDYVAVCGPPLMERSVALPAIEHGVTCEVSMERLMACGVGACLGCVVETRDGLKRCCVDGPVFDASEVIW